MLSILIPFYNYDIKELLKSIHSQCLECNTVFEIIALDDGSGMDTSLFISEKNITFLKNNTNIGRTETRQKLAKKATYNWLLFLDADVLPVERKYIKNYINLIKSKEFDVSFGGFKYRLTPPENNKILRWKYGTKKEDITVKERLKNPYKVIISANLLIKKDLFLDINKNLDGNFYGYDNIFSIQLKNRNSKIAHINNPVWHLGLEPNDVYLKKKELAAKTILMLYKKQQLNSSSNDLLKTFEFLKKLKLTYLTAYIFSKTQFILKKNILSSNPSINILNLYRLGYLCKQYSN